MSCRKEYETCLYVTQNNQMSQNATDSLNKHLSLHNFKTGITAKSSEMEHYKFSGTYENV
jgi:hypothetical protein